MIPKTIIKIYIDALKRNGNIKLTKDKSQVLVYNYYDLSLVSKFKMLFNKPAIAHIIKPVGNKMGDIIPNGSMKSIQIVGQHFHYRMPRCTYSNCGINIEYGYKYCDSHRLICMLCNKRESNISINMVRLCYVCCTGEY